MQLAGIKKHPIYTTLNGNLFLEGKVVEFVHSGQHTVADKASAIRHFNANVLHMCKQELISDADVISASLSK